MAIDSQKSYFILVGPEDKAQIRDAAVGMAPRLDYQLLAEQIGGTIIEGIAPPALLPSKKPIGILRSFLANSLMVARLLPRIPDGSVIFSSGETWGLPCALANALYRRRHFIHIVYLHRVFSRNWRWILRMLRPLLNVDGWICVTKKQKLVLREVLGPTTRIEVVSQGVDTVFFEPALADATDHGEQYILSVGAEMRDYALLFDATKQLDVAVVVKASSSWMKGARDQVSDVSSNVQLIEKRLTYRELRDLYAGASLVAVPLKDTLQAAGITTILEAMAMGKCVIATRSTGLPDILTDKSTGFIVGSNASEFSGILSDVLTMDDKREKIAECAYQAVREEASLENYASAIAAFMRSMGS